MAAVCVRDVDGRGLGSLTCVDVLHRHVRAGRASQCEEQGDSFARIDDAVDRSALGGQGGARRDEERSRAKERIVSFRDDFGGWDPRSQRPELWGLYNARVRRGEVAAPNSPGEAAS